MQEAGYVANSESFCSEDRDTFKPNDWAAPPLLLPFVIIIIMIILIAEMLWRVPQNSDF